MIKLEFKKWMIQEMGYFRLDPPEYNIEIIDFRFEDWKSGYGEFTPVLAKLPGFSNIYIIKDRLKDVAEIAPLQPAQVEELIKGGLDLLSDDWFKYAQIVYADGNVKNGIKQ